MTTTQLNILRTIAKHQPVSRRNLYSSMPDFSPRTLANYLCALSNEGYVSYGERRGNVWLTVKGREVIDEI